MGSLSFGSVTRKARRLISPDRTHKCELLHISYSLMLSDAESIACCTQRSERHRSNG